MLVGSGSIVKERMRRWSGGAAMFGVAAAVCVIGLAGCSSLNPIANYRDLTGASKDDPSKDEANTANLEAGSQEPFPSVGSVPGTPTRGLTESQREKLQQGLVVDRGNAHYIDSEVTKGNSSAVMPAQAPVPEEQLPMAIPPSADAAPVAVASSAPRPAGGHGGPGQSAPVLPHTPTAPPQPVAADKDSALVTPVPRALPDPETVPPPPPPPELKPLPPSTGPTPFPGAPALPPQPEPLPAQVAGIPVPPLPPSRPENKASAPEIPPAPDVQTQVFASAGKHAKSTQIAEVAFVIGGTALSPEAPEKLKIVPSLHQQYGGVVRVVGYASLPPQGGTDPAGQQLAAYQAALARAKLIKDALVQTGVPAADIVTEASPVHGTGAAADRADIYDEY
jgi:outer membrane protein OmpA-like peptidoglycan-associated protein